MPLNLDPVTPLPDPPLKTSPADFAERADAFLGGLPVFQTELNAVITALNSITSGLDQQTPIAAWAVGTSYSFPTVVAGSDGYSYRCLGTGVAGVDPTTDDGTNWVALTVVPKTAPADEGKVLSIDSAGKVVAARIPQIDSLENIGNAGTSRTLDTASYDTFTLTCDQATLDLSATSIALGRTVTLVLTGADDCAITWPAGTKWPGGSPPSFSAGTDRVVIQRVSATVIHASLAGSAYA